MAKNNLTSAQLCTIWLSSMAALCIVNFASILSSLTKLHSWFAIVLIAVITLLFLLLSYSVMKAAKFKDPYVVFCGALGNFFGTAAYGLVLIYLFIVTMISLRVFIHIINLFYLPSTPLWAISTLIILPVLYSVWGGMRHYGHTSAFVWLFLLIFLLMFFITKRSYDWFNLFPLADGNILDVIPKVPLLFINSFALILPFLFLPVVVNPQKYKGNAIIFVLLAMGLMFFVYIVGKSFFGDSIENAVLPFYHLSTSYKGRFFERIDVIFTAVLVPTMGLYVSTFFAAFYRAQAAFFKKVMMRHEGILLLIYGALIVAAVSFIHVRTNIWQLLLVENVINLGLFGGFIFIYLIYLVRRRKFYEK